MNILNELSQNFLQYYQWDSPLTFAIGVIFILVLVGQLRMALIMALAVAFGSLSNDLMIAQSDSTRHIVSVSIVIYGIALAFIVAPTISSVIRSFWYGNLLNR